MKHRQKALNVTLAIMMAGAAIAAPAEKLLAQDYLKGTNVQPVGLTTARVCNQSQDPAAVAAMYHVVGHAGLRNQGWWRVEPGTCQDLFQTVGDFFYIYAINANNPSIHWGLNAAVSIQNGCITFPKSFDFFMFADAPQQACPFGTVPVTFGGSQIKPSDTIVTAHLG